MLKKINKKYVYIIMVLFLTISFIVGFSWINSSYTLASGNIIIDTPSCSNQNLYDRLACMSSIDSIQSKYVTNSIQFGREVQSKNEINDEEAQNGLGIYTLTRTLNDEYPVYYYRGDVDNNNIKFGGFCWKILRTTSTGGTKLLYNGETKSNGECSDDTEDSHIIGSSSFESNNSDYMKSTQSTKYINLTGIRMTYKYGVSTSTNLNFSNSYTYDTSTRKYTLVSPQDYNWSNDYNSLKGYYTCSINGTATECNTLYYVVEPYISSAAIFRLENGETVESIDTTIAFGDSYINNGNGTYTLQNVEHIKKSEWPTKYSNANRYYACVDNNETCSNIQSINSRDVEAYWYYSVDDAITFGKSITFDGTNYVLNDTIDFWDFSYNNVNEIYNLYSYDYTFYDLSDHTSVYKIFNKTYITSSVNKSFKASIISNGDLEVTRSTNSSIKTMIDDWYTNNLSSVSNKIEDTPYCSDTRSNRVIYANGSNTYPQFFSQALSRKNTGLVDISCNKSDSYTVGSTGNGLLANPIGLMTVDEAVMAGYSAYALDSSDKSFINIGTDYYLMTPSEINNNNFYINNNMIKYGTTSKGVRPVISLKNNVQITSGTGTLNNPYIVS